MTPYALAGICAAIDLAALAWLAWDTIGFRRHLARHAATRAPEARREALGHVRVVPPEAVEAVAEALDAVAREDDVEFPVEDDVFLRTLKALEIYAAHVGEEAPYPMHWAGIAAATTVAILGEDLAGALAGAILGGRAL